MSQTLRGSVTPRRLVALLMAALFGLTLALNPIAAPPAHAVTADQARAAVSLRALRIAAAQVGVPYLWGGTTRRGFDCSGLTQYAYARAGKSLPRTAQQQYLATSRVIRHRQRLGDLIFIYTGSAVNRTASNVGHVAIYAGKGYYWSAPRTGLRVKLVKLYTTRYVFGRVR